MLLRLHQKIAPEWVSNLVGLFEILSFARGSFVSIGKAFLAGISEQPNAASISPVAAIYLWGAFIANRLAKVLDPRFHYYWTITALMFIPVVNLIAIISLFMA